MQLLMAMSDDDANDHTTGRTVRSQAYFSHAVRTNNELDRLNSYGGIAVDFTPCLRSPVHLIFNGFRSDSISLWSASADHGFIITPKYDFDLLTVRFVTNGSIIRHTHSGVNYIGSINQAMLDSYESMRDAQASAGFSGLIATVTRQAVLTACEALDGASTHSLPQFVPVVDATSKGMIALKNTLIALNSGIHLGAGTLELISPLMEEIFIYQMISLWPKFEEINSPPSATSSQSIRRAIDYIEANLSRKLTIAEIAGASGVGVRALQVAFRRQVGRTPVQYLIDRRLERAHEALQASGGIMTISQIATQLGFVHMSDFSRRYRQRYGYAPRKSGL